MNHCNCTIFGDLKGKRKPSIKGIAFCPIHAAAPELLSACKETLIILRKVITRAEQVKQEGRQ